MDQVALNTVFAVMMAIFPGFLFRKCYYRGEFTKQFSQSNEFDKLLWNIFFSGVSIGITFLSIYAFRSVFKLEVLNSLSYDSINKIAVPISDNKIPEKDIFFKTYKDLIFTISLIYFFSCFFGLTLHWLVRTLKLDILFPLFRFKNYWYYYIHGGKILYTNPTGKKLAFTAADLLCEVAGETKMYSGIISQYTISKEDNNLENIFLTNARALKQVKDENGNTIEVKKREIPGATFCIPYKTVANMNLVYVYRNNPERNFKKFFKNLVNIIWFILGCIIFVSLWFDLKAYGIEGIWRKSGYIFWSFLGLANLRLLLLPETKSKYAWVSQSAFILTAMLWLSYYAGLVPIWISILSIVLWFISASLISSDEEGDDTPNA